MKNFGKIVIGLAVGFALALVHAAFPGLIFATALVAWCLLFLNSVQKSQALLRSIDEAQAEN